MKIPIECPICAEFLELERRDHQHLTCSGCGVEFCFQCVDPTVVASSVHEYQRRHYSTMVN